MFAPSHVVAILGYALLLVKAGWWVLPLVILISVPALMLGVRHGTEGYFLSREQSMESRMAGYLSSLLTGRDAVKEVRVFGLNQYLGNKWRELSRRLVAERLSLNITQQKRSIFIDAASVLLIFGSIGAFAFSAGRGDDQA